MKPVLTISDPKVPAFDGLTINLPEIPLTGLAGSLLSKALEGKHIGASLTIAETAEGRLSETLTVDGNAPFLAALVKSVTESQEIPDFVAAAIKEVAPNGISLAATLSLGA